MDPVTARELLVHPEADYGFWFGIGAPFLLAGIGGVLVLVRKLTHLGTKMDAQSSLLTVFHADNKDEHQDIKDTNVEQWKAIAQGRIDCAETRGKVDAICRPSERKE